jgi:hypothetical protein
MEFSDNFEIHTFSEENFFKCLRNQFHTDSEVLKTTKNLYLFNYLDHIGVKTIISELNYIDRDYLEDFSDYYVRCFSEYKRWCKRVHFFSNDFLETDFLSLIRHSHDKDNSIDLQAEYCGFIVLRPLPDAIIGRTVLKVYEKTKENGVRYYPCVRPYNINLFSIQLTLKSLAFQEQDSVLAACATVALWCCFHKTYQLFRTHLLSPSKITRLANNGIRSGRLIPSAGLSVEQICSVIRQVDLEPELFSVGIETPLLSLIYAYLKMEIPVLLVVAQKEYEIPHAITVTGFSLKEERVLDSEVKSHVRSVPMIALKIDEFYAHDDQLGPFSRLKIIGSNQKSDCSEDDQSLIILEESWIENGSEKSLQLIPLALIVPVYHKIRVNFIDVRSLLTRLHHLLEESFPNWSSSLEWDVFLTDVNNYKKSCYKLPIDRLSIDRILLRHHPKYIWRSTLYYHNSPILEILIDATDIAHSCPIHQVSWLDISFKNSFSRLFAEENRSRIRGALTSRFFEVLRDSLT